jgi:thiol-disulfide isomerase/thioredoxin
MNPRILSIGLLLAAAYPAAGQPETTVSADLVYRAPGSNGPRPDFSPYGTEVKLIDLAANAQLPEGATRPAKTGTMAIGPNQNSWIEILVTADADYPRDLCRLYIDRNRNGNFSDDGPAISVKLEQNEKTKAWWSSFNGAEVSIPYGAGVVEPYTVNFWAVREGESTPDIIRYSVASWRSASVNVDGVEALVAVMDADNDAVFGAKDKWSVLSAAQQDAARRVLSIKEARPMNRLMFVERPGSKDLVLEFRGMSADGRSLTFAVVNRPVTKLEDRAPDDTLAAERSRPRTDRQFPWIDGNLDRGLALAKESGRKVIVDFWATWCGPCRSLDEWIWSDAEVAARLSAGYVGVKLDADLENELVKRFHVEGYPTMIVLDPSGKEIKRFGYLSSKGMLQTLPQ